MKYELDYNGSRGGLAESVVRNTNHLLKEVEILEGVEQSLSDFISASLRGLKPEVQRGNVWLNRFNASEGGQDAFNLEFTPTESEREEVKFDQAVIANGRFLSKEIHFFNGRCRLYYVEAEYIPFLKEMFKKFGFKIIE